MPPPDAQEAIAEAKETAKLDDLQSATERTTSLLKERKAPMIPADMTGKYCILHTRQKVIG